MKLIMSSEIYRNNFNLKYTEETETEVSKLYRACVIDEQGLLVGYMLLNNPTLFRLRLADKDLNSDKTYDAIDYV